jgi:hypothetical protein
MKSNIWVRFPMITLKFFNLHNPSSRILAMDLIQLLTEMSTRNLSGGKVRPARKANNITAIYEKIA